MTLAVQEGLMSVGEFLDWHPEGERWELVGGLPLRMMAEGDLHETVKSNVIVAVGRRLRAPSPCRPAVDGRQVKIDDFTSYRPDAHINCAPFSEPMEQVVQCPTVVFEVAVSSLERDLLEKRANYFRHPAVEHVVVIEAPVQIVHHFRRGDRKARVLGFHDALVIDGTVSLDIPVAEFFEFLPGVQ